MCTRTQETCLFGDAHISYKSTYAVHLRWSLPKSRELVESTQPWWGACRGEEGIRPTEHIHWLYCLAVASDKFQKAKLLIKYCGKAGHRMPLRETHTTHTPQNGSLQDRSQEQVLKAESSCCLEKIKNKEEQETLKRKSCRVAAKGAFNTAAESNNKSPLSPPPLSHTGSYREPSKENSKKTVLSFGILWRYSTYKASIGQWTCRKVKTVQDQFCNNYYAISIAHFKGQNSVYRWPCKCKYFLKGWSYWNKETDGKTSIPLFWASLKCPLRAKTDFSIHFSQNHRWVFSSH